HVTTGCYTLSLHDALPIYGEQGDQPDHGEAEQIARRGEVDACRKPVERRETHGQQRLPEVEREAKHGDREAFGEAEPLERGHVADRKSTRLNSSHEWISYA